MTDPGDAALSFDAAVVGGGPSGLAAALGLAQGGLKVGLVARRADYADNRTSALLGPSVDWLEHLGVWPDCLAAAAPMRAIRLVDDTGGLIRAPEVRFDAGEIGRDAFGYNIENRRLVAVLEDHLARQAGVTRFDAGATHIEPADDAVHIRTSNGEGLCAPLVVGADGRNSPCRAAAGIGMHHRDYPQTAMTFNVAHARPHHDTSTEFHTREGPCVIVPLPGQRVSVVWVMSPARAQDMVARDDATLSIAIERQCHSVLGRMDVEPGRFLFPLAAERADGVAARRIALVGEAAHVVPPIGAQGLNLGLRDARDITGAAVAAWLGGHDPGGPDVLRRYGRARSFDIAARSRLIDTANRTLLSGFLPVQAMRAAGLQLLAAFGPLRRAAMRGGLGEALLPSPRRRDGVASAPQA